MMERCWKEVKEIAGSRWYLLCVGFVAFCAYGFELTHISIGIDDTELSLYYDDGLDPVMGRWVLYLLNKFLLLTKIAPVLTDALGVLFLCVSACIYCVLLKRIFGKRFDRGAQVLFSCLFISYPLISFVYRFYLHDAIGLANICTALSLLGYHESLGKPVRERWKTMVVSAVFLWVAVGCYESFLVLYLLGILTILFLEAAYREWKLSFRRLLSEFLAVVGSVCAVMLARSIMIFGVSLVFALEIPGITTVGLRSVSEMSALFGPDGRAVFHMLIKRFWVMYHLNALVFLPVTVYEIACLMFGLLAVCYSIRKRNVFYFLLYLGMLITPFLLVIIEAKITFYRTCQYLPYFSALGMTLVYLSFVHAPVKQGLVSKGLHLAGIMFAGVFVFNQVTWLSADFRMENQEYEYSKEYLIGAAQDVMRLYGTEYPVVFVGGFDLPYEFVKDYYAPYSSGKYRLVTGIMDLVDDHLKDKFSDEIGYCYLNEGTLPMIRWAYDAFDGTNREMIAFLRMHGYTFRYLEDPDEYREIRSRLDRMELPRWPREGSVFMEEGYVIVNF